MKKYIYASLLFGLLIICVGCNKISKNDVINWKIDLPENHGINSAAAGPIYNSIISSEEILSFLVIKDGHLISEYYAEGYNKNSLFPFNSCAKSITSAVIGIALDMGFIDNLNVKVADYFPQFTDNSKNEITIEHLLSFTCGLDWPEHSRNWNPVNNEWFRSENWIDFVLERNITAAPGAVFNYNSGAVHLLSGILQKATGKKLSNFAKKQLFNKIGIKSVKWSSDPQGITVGGGGIYMTSRDAAKFGQLYANNGKWGDKKIIPQDWVKISTKKHSEGDFNYGSFGYLWWVDDVGTNKKYHMFFDSDMGGQFIFVVPELNLVSVITSKNFSYKTIRSFKKYIEDGII